MRNRAGGAERKRAAGRTRKGNSPRSANGGRAGALREHQRRRRRGERSQAGADFTGAKELQSTRNNASGTRRYSDTLIERGFTGADIQDIRAQRECLTGQAGRSGVGISSEGNRVGPCNGKSVGADQARQGDVAGCASGQIDVVGTGGDSTDRDEGANRRAAIVGAIDRRIRADGRPT